MRKTLFPLLAILLITCLSSCLEYTTTIVINKDGSGQIEETSLVGPQLKAILAQMQQSAGAAAIDPKEADALKSLLPSQEKAQERAKSLGDGVTVKSREEISSPDGREGVKIVYAVTDVRKLNFRPFDANVQKEEKPMTFALSGNQVTINLPKPDKKVGSEKEPKMPEVPKEQLEAQMPMVKTMLGGMHVSFKVRAPGGIAKTTATHSEGDTVTLMDIQMDKVLEKPEALPKVVGTLQQGNMSSAQVADVMKKSGVDGVVIEPKESLSIDLK